MIDNPVYRNGSIEDPWHDLMITQKANDGLCVGVRRRIYYALESDGIARHTERTKNRAQVRAPHCCIASPSEALNFTHSNSHARVLHAAVHAIPCGKRSRSNLTPTDDLLFDLLEE
jgi:hypothetical protein